MRSAYIVHIVDRALTGWFKMRGYVFPRQCLVFLNIPVMQQPEVYLANIAGAMDDEGNITDDDVKKILQDAMDAAADWFRKFA